MTTILHSNHRISGMLAFVLGLFVSMSCESCWAWQGEAKSKDPYAQKKRRILYNLDGDSCMTLKAGRLGPGPIGLSDLTNLVTELTAPQSMVDTLLVCVNAQVMYYPSRVGTMRGHLSTPEEKSRWSNQEVQRFENMQRFFDAGTDPYAVILAEARRKGIEALITFRMNDDHGVDFLRTSFWQEQPEARLGKGALNFGVDKTREYVFRLIEESLQRYDCDGIELDFQRFPTFFKDGTAAENVQKMNSLVRRVRDLVDAESLRRGRKLVLGVRAPSEYGLGRPQIEQATAPSRGCDLQFWAEKKWIDFLSISEWLFVVENLELNQWRSKITGIPIYAGIQPESKPSAASTQCEFCIGAEGYRRIARQRWDDGADGIYLFNFFTSREWQNPTEPPFQVLSEIGDARALAKLPIRPSFRIVSPKNLQVFQRRGSVTTDVEISGELSEPLRDLAKIEMFWEGKGIDAGWTLVENLVPGQRAFRRLAALPTGGWYSLRLRVIENNTVVLEHSIDRVGVGEVFVVAGQSNSANHGEERQQVTTDLVATFDGEQWRIAHDPQPGASGNGGSFIPAFADTLALELGVPIGIVAAGAGGTSVREWLPAGSRFPNPPTVLSHVVRIAEGQWESKGNLFSNLVRRLRSLGPHGCRAVLWHQGESDANQSDPTRTLAGSLYTKYLGNLIETVRKDIGWPIPWFVAQATYHTPEDPGSSEIRSAQAELWNSGLALQGPDTDALKRQHRDGQGNGVHFNAVGLKQHGALWSVKVLPWLKQQTSSAPRNVDPPSNRVGIPISRLKSPSTQNFEIEGRNAFILWPAEAKRSNPQPWIFYAPTLPAYPDEAERWMHDQFLDAGVAVAGIDVGEGYGSPKSHPLLNTFYSQLVQERGFSKKPCVFGRSRGGLWVSSWAARNTDKVSGLIGIYPVYDFTTYPGLKATAPSYGLPLHSLTEQIDVLNPIKLIKDLARARIPATLIHGDKDLLVPLKENSQEFLNAYKSEGVGDLVNLIILDGQGHSFFRGYFTSEPLVRFAITRARSGAGL